MNTKNIRFASNRVRDIESQFHHELDSLYGQGEVEAFITLLFEHIFGWSRVRRMTSREACVDQSDLLKLHWALEELTRQRPIQHIIGHADFCGCRIEVSSDVLIPRPETAEMVDWIVKNLPEDARQGKHIDLCTGSGCIAIALKRAFPLADITAADISDAALEVARRNASTNQTGLNIMKADVLHPDATLTGTRYDLMVSNPPYVCESERKEMRPNVLDYEPALALFVPDDDPLRFYRAIGGMAARQLTEGGLLVMEINERLATETCQLLEGLGLAATTHLDFNGKERFVSATRADASL